MKNNIKDQILEIISNNDNLNNEKKKLEISFLLYQLYFQSYTDLFSLLKEQNNQDLITISFDVIKSTCKEYEIQECFQLLNSKSRQLVFLDLLKDSNQHLNTLSKYLNNENKDFLFYHSLVYNNQYLISSFVNDYNPENDDFKSLEMLLRRHKYQELEYIIKKHSIDEEKLVVATKKSNNFSFVLKNFESYSYNTKEEIILSLDDYTITNNIKSVFTKICQINIINEKILKKLISILDKDQWEIILNKSNLEEMQKFINKINANKDNNEMNNLGFDILLNLTLLNKSDNYSLLMEKYNDLLLKEKLNDELKNQLEKNNSKNKRKI